VCVIFLDYRLSISLDLKNNPTLPTILIDSIAKVKIASYLYTIKDLFTDTTSKNKIDILISMVVF